MTEADGPVFARGLCLLAETFNEPVSDLRSEAYWSALSDLSLEEFNQAVRAAIGSSPFFPRPAELRALTTLRRELPAADPPYEKSCFVYGHEPACPSYREHLRRLDAERAAAGGEAALKAKVGYWERLFPGRDPPAEGAV